MRLEGRRAIVTGAARGIGRAIVEEFLREGATVMACDITGDRLKETVDELAALGPVCGTSADVTRRSDVNALVQATLDWCDHIDILVNNAGYTRFTPFLRISEAEWASVLSTNLTSVFQCSQAVAHHMKARRSGAIVNVASVNGLAGEPDEAHYNAAKAGVIMLSKSMALELAPHDIRVNSVCPGFIDTDLAVEAGLPADEKLAYKEKIPLGRVGLPAEIATAVRFLASDDASFVTGTELIIDGGQTCGL